MAASLVEVAVGEEGGRERGGGSGLGHERGGGDRIGDAHAQTSRAGATRGHKCPSTSLEVMETIYNFEQELEDQSSLPPTPSPLLSSLEARA
jgi:hypothetical protein